MILGVLGGSGLYDFDGLSDPRLDEVSTPFGPPSAPVAAGGSGARGSFFCRVHGRGHRYSPSEINYRANVFALKTLGAERVLSVSAVGSLREGLAPGDFVLPISSSTRPGGGRRRSSATASSGTSGSRSRPAGVRAAVAAAAASDGKRVHRGGTYVCMEGPQFSTRAESQLHRSWGADVIGMTGATEAKLCREAEVCFVSLALVTDYDAWHAEEAAVSVEAGHRRAARERRGAQDIIAGWGTTSPARPVCCARAAGPRRHHRA
jgi:5'-methylthioadenosine phosphorylase